jgi:hypothetical protein
MAIQVSGTEVISNARALTNIASVDATTVASLAAAGVGGGTWTVLGTSGNLGTLSAGSGVSAVKSFTIPAGVKAVSIEIQQDISLVSATNSSAVTDLYMSSKVNNASLSSFGDVRARSSTVAGSFNGTFKYFIPFRVLTTYVDDPSTNTFDGMNNAANGEPYINLNLSDGAGTYIQPTDTNSRNWIVVASKISGSDSTPYGASAYVSNTFFQFFAHTAKHCGTSHHRQASPQT